MLPQSLLGTAIGNRVIDSAKQESVRPFFDALKLADVQRRRKEEMNTFGKLFSSLLGGEGGGAGAQSHSSVKLPGLPHQQRKQRQKMPNMGAQMIESLLGMGV